MESKCLLLPQRNQNRRHLARERDGIVMIAMLKQDGEKYWI